MRKRGIRVLPGGDYGFPYTPHGTYARDLSLFVKVLGFSPMETLVAATRLGGELMGRPGELGVVQEGALADLLLVDGDPLADIDDPAGPRRAPHDHEGRRDPQGAPVIGAADGAALMRRPIPLGSIWCPHCEKMTDHQLSILSTVDPDDLPLEPAEPPRGSRYIVTCLTCRNHPLVVGASGGDGLTASRCPSPERCRAAQRRSLVVGVASLARFGALRFAAVRHGATLARLAPLARLPLLVALAVIVGVAFKRWTGATPSSYRRRAAA